MLDHGHRSRSCFSLSTRPMAWPLVLLGIAAIAGTPAFVPVVHAGGDPTVADLLYDPDTGDILMDQTEAPGGIITNFVLQSDGNFIAPGVADFPFAGIFFTDLDFEISQSDPLTAGWDAADNPWNLGPILPSGFSLDQVTQIITSARYVGQLGSGIHDFEIALFEGVELIIGDLDLNGRVDFDDIGAFVLGLNDEPAYIAQFGRPPVDTGDTDGNGRFDFDDIPGFVALLGGGDLASVAVPEPTTLLLSVLGLCAVLVRRRTRR